MSNSKRSADVNAHEFCILHTFSRTDYNNLKNEFKGLIDINNNFKAFIDIGPRLRSGLRHYKNTHMSLLIQILKNLNIFESFTDTEVSSFFVTLILTI